MRGFRDGAEEAGIDMVTDVRGSMLVSSSQKIGLRASKMPQTAIQSYLQSSTQICWIGEYI